MKLLFSPIDIDVDQLSFKKEGVNIKEFQEYWNSTTIKNVESLKHIIDQLPFRQLTVCTHKIQKKVVGAHVDVFDTMIFQEGELEHIKAHEPCGFRILLKGATDSLEIYNGKQWVTANVPNAPSCYVINSTDCKHRVKQDDLRETIYLRGIIDKNRHSELIRRSLEKYSNNAIYQI